MTELKFIKVKDGKGRLANFPPMITQEDVDPQPGSALMDSMYNEKMKGTGLTFDFGGETY